MTAPQPGGFLDRGGRWVLLQNAFTLSLVVAGPVGHLEAWPAPIRWIGFSFLALASFLGISGAWAMGRHLSPFPRSHRARHLIRDGIYRRVRHPLYGALITFGFGWALVWSSPTAVALAFGHALTLVGKASVEEAWLRSRFPEYPDYTRATKRFIPFFW